MLKDINKYVIKSIFTLSKIKNDYKKGNLTWLFELNCYETELCDMLIRGKITQKAYEVLLSETHKFRKENNIFLKTVDK